MASKNKAKIVSSGSTPPTYNENKSADSAVAQAAAQAMKNAVAAQEALKTKYNPENSDYYKQMQALTGSMSAAAANQTAYLNGRNKQDTQDASDAYTANARTAYINYLKQKNAANETLRNNGVNGGASETALLNIGNNYNRNLSTNDASRAAAIAGINTNYADAINQMQYENAMAIADMQSTYYQLAIQDMENRKQQDLENFYATNTNFKNKDAVKNAINNLNPNDPLYDIKSAYLNNIKNDPNLKAAKKKSSSKSTSKSASGGYSGGTNNDSGNKVAYNPKLRGSTDGMWKKDNTPTHTSSKEKNPYVKGSALWYIYNATHK